MSGVDSIIVDSQLPRPEETTTPDADTVPGASAAKGPPLPQTESSAPSQGVATAAAVSKVTLYIRPEQVLAVEEIQLKERRRTGQKRDKSELVQEALDLLIEKYQAA